MLTASAAVALALAGQAINPATGVYRAPGHPTQTWTIQSNNTLLWDGRPYVPVGLVLEPGAESVARAKEAGVTDVLVQLPASGDGWAPTLAALEEARLRYVIEIGSLGPSAQGIAVEPESYRMDGIDGARQIILRLPGATSALVILASNNDATINFKGRFPVENGILTASVDPKVHIEHTMLIFPETTGGALPDYWDRFDDHRDGLLSVLRDKRPGPGLRGIVNPGGVVSRLVDLNPSYVPTSPAFRIELANFIQEKYTSVDTLTKGWAMRQSDQLKFEEFARLVPLWSETRGVGQLWDPVTDRLYPADRRRSAIWTDIRQVIARAANRRMRNLVNAIRAEVDVPVMQEWMGWSSMVEGRGNVMDGIGVRAVGSSPNALIETMAPAAGTILRWSRPGWLIATRVDLGSDLVDDESLQRIVEILGGIGTRGFFVRTQSANQDRIVASTSLHGSRAFADLGRITPLFFPENAANPAVAMQLPGGRWWLPSPIRGNRIDFGDTYDGYRYEDFGETTTVMWRNAAPARVKLRAPDPKAVSIASIDGSDLQPRLHRNSIEVTLGPSPVIITGVKEPPVPEDAYTATKTSFEAMSREAETKKLNVVELQHYYRQATTEFDDTPWTSFTLLRTMWWRLNEALGNYVWAEFETVRDHNFSEVMPDHSASGGNVLSLRSALASPENGHYAEFLMPVRSNQDQEVWLAARIPPGLERFVQVTVGGQVLQPEGPSVGRYGSGFGWYRLGTTRVAGASTRVRLQVDAPAAAAMSFDAILFTPDRFVPNGVRMPVTRIGS
ncbi:MAG: hypothetical protein ACK4XJ_11015 [Fimbriimonadaceae bacterium]